MTFRQFQCQFRLLIDSAWAAHCREFGCPSSDSWARDRWYRDQLQSATSGRIRSTRDAGPEDYSTLLAHFQVIAPSAHSEAIPQMHGWTDRQNERFAELAAKAWQRDCGGDAPGMQPWLEAILQGCGISGWRACDMTDSFDRVMAELAVLAADEYWIGRTSQASETRIQWRLAALLEDVTLLSGSSAGWDYVLGIWRQARQLPARMEDAPADLLIRVLQMLDTHVRRLARAKEIALSDLPSRQPSPAVPL